MHGLPENTSATMDAFLAKVPDSELASVQAELARMMAAAGSYQIEYRVLGEDGNLRSMEARGRVVPGPDGRPARMMGLITDITAARAKRETAERRLVEITDRTRRTQDFTAALASAMTVEAIVDAARDGLSGYGANCFVLIASRDGILQEVASYGLRRECVVALSGLASAHRTPISDAIKWRTPVYLGVPAALAQEYPHLAGVLDPSAQGAWVALPVPDARGKVGACLLGFAEPHEFAPEDHAMLYAASGLLAQSVERAHMYESQRALAAELQRGMLPHGALAAPGLSVATKYQPATSGLEIGGDFYDLIRLPDGQVALIIGDVEGHNLVAASVMGQLRIAVPGQHECRSRGGVVGDLLHRGARPGDRRPHHVPGRPSAARSLRAG
jgi:GAF domain-containing protein